MIISFLTISYLRYIFSFLVLIMLNNEPDMYIYDKDESEFLKQFQPLRECAGICREVFLARLCPINQQQSNKSIARKIFLDQKDPLQAFEYHWDKIINLLDKYREFKLLKSDNNSRILWKYYFQWLWNEEYKQWKKNINLNLSTAKSINQINRDESRGTQIYINQIDTFNYSNN